MTRCWSGRSLRCNGTSSETGEGLFVGWDGELQSGSAPFRGQYVCLFCVFLSVVQDHPYI